MPTIKIQDITVALQHHGVAPEKQRAIIEELNHLSAPADEGEKPPPVKKQWVVVVSDPEGILPKRDFVGWVVQIPEEESPATVRDRILRGAYDFNASKRGRLLPVKTVGEALENAGKHFKEADLWVRTRTPVTLVVMANTIPQDLEAHIDHRRADAAG
jgi:hypothetical protein